MPYKVKSTNDILHDGGPHASVDRNQLTVTNLSTSSMMRTGALKYKTAFHSTQLSGVIAKSVCGGNGPGRQYKGPLRESREKVQKLGKGQRGKTWRDPCVGVGKF